MEKLILKYPVIVEGKYDKIKLANVVSSPIIVLNGFSVFNDANKKELIKKMCADGAILLTDSDKAGAFIRSKLKGHLKDVVLYNVYTPQIKGKEKRKDSPSAQGLLGVEGMDSAVLYDLLLNFSIKNGESNQRRKYTKSDMYELGLSGGENSKEKREELAKHLGLPQDMTPNALLEAINLLGIEL